MSTVIAAGARRKRSPDMRRRYRRAALVVVVGLLALLGGLTIYGLMSHKDVAPDFGPVEQSRGIAPGR